MLSPNSSGNTGSHLFEDKFTWTYVSANRISERIAGNSPQMAERNPAVEFSLVRPKIRSRLLIQSLAS